MNKNVIIAVVAGLVIGIGSTLGMTALVNSDDSKQAQQTASTDHSTMSMTDMNKELEGLSGDEFDAAFIEMMIAHHQGAIDMAELAPERAKHEEIKELSKDIIEAQTSEISEMYEWQSMWGYESTNTEMDHSAH